MVEYEPEEFEWKPEKVEVELSEKEFIELLSRDQFLECLRVAGKETKKGGYETGFSIYIDEKKKIDFGHVIRGSLDSINEYEEDTEIIMQGIDRPELDEEGDTGEISFHFHPNPGEPLCPSEADLHLLHEYKIFGVTETINSLVGICTIDRSNNIDVLLVKVKKGIHASEVEDNAHFFDEAVDKEYGVLDNYKRSPEVDDSIQRHLGENGFDSCLISYKYDKKNKQYFLTEDSKEKIIKFGGLKFNLDKKYE